MIQALVSQSPDIQKVLAFEGAFEKLFNIISHEGGIEGGFVAQEVLTCIDSLLRYNSSNQVMSSTLSIVGCVLTIPKSYFQGTAIPPVLCQLLLFPPNLPPNQAAPQEFALQFWDEQKMTNALYVVSIIGMLVTIKGTVSSFL